MTDKFISPCSQPELLEAMAKAHHNKEITWIGLEAGEEALRAVDWETHSEKGKAAKMQSMAAALEALKDPPEEFLQEVHNAVYELVSKDELGFILQAAINQTLKEGE